MGERKSPGTSHRPSLRERAADLGLLMLGQMKFIRCGKITSYLTLQSSFDSPLAPVQKHAGTGCLFRFSGSPDRSMVHGGSQQQRRYLYLFTIFIFCRMESFPSWVVLVGLCLASTVMWNLASQYNFLKSGLQKEA